MSYTPTIWATGDVITADKLNHMETGIDGTDEQVIELKSAFDYLGFSETSFLYTNGNIHSSTNDNVFLNIKNGERFTISVESSDNSQILVTPFAYGPNGVGDQLSYISFTGSGSKEYTANADYTSIGLYIAGSYTTRNIKFIVNRADSILYVAPFAKKINGAVSNIIYENKAQFNSDDFQRGGINGSTGELLNYQFRVCSYGHAFKFSYKLNITANSGFRFGVATFDENGNVLSDLGWKTTFAIPSNTIFKISIARTSENTSEIADVDTFVSQLYFDTKSASEIRDLQPTSASYHYDGNLLDFKKSGYDVLDLFSVPTKPSGATGSQAFAINNGVLFQLYNDNKVTLVDFSSGSVIGTLDINSDHGDSIDFSNEFYDLSDEFPLAYITADTTPAKVYVVRITRNTTSLIRTLYFGDISKTGYMAGHCLDKYNNVLYMVGYTENSYYLDDSGTNLMIVSKWDLNNCATNQDGTITPMFIDSFTVPFIRTAQGQQYFREKIYIVSSHNLAGGYPIDTKVYVIDPFKKTVTNILTDFPPTIKDVETEGIDFVLDGTEYCMVLGNTKYYELRFK